MPERFYCTTFQSGGQAELQGPEAHHLLYVLRLKVGAPIELFDGAGNEACATVTATSRSAATLGIERTWIAPQAPGPALCLAVAPPKGDRLRWLIEKATELGVTRLQLLQTARSIVEPGAGKLAKLVQTVIASCKQCGRSRLMSIEPAVPWDEFLESIAPDAQRFIADRAGDAAPRTTTGDAIVVAVGPEGGFTTAEVDSAAARGFQRLALAAHTLRIETAAIAAAAMFARAG